MTTTTHYAVIESVNSTGTVYGIGASPEAALADAREWIDQGETTDDLITVPCTAAAARWIEDHSGQTSVHLSVSSRGVSLRSEEE